MNARRLVAVITLTLFSSLAIAVWQGRGAKQSDRSDSKPWRQETDANRFEGKALIIQIDRAIDERDA
ncbi:MAG TPA: hypothetical protein VFE46_06815 [Pirellulales bacterium]|jgi:hypothetical protein|nr:hypothetical protein [Pirellulales bacterium]